MRVATVLVGLVAAVLLAPPAAAQVILDESFEDLPLGTTFPCCYPWNPNPDGWELVYSGWGTSYQTVVSDPADPGGQCLELWGRYMWSSVIQHRFTSDSPALAFSYRIFITALGSYHAEHPALSCYRCELPYDPWGTYYGAVSFSHVPILPWTPSGFGEIWSEDQNTFLGTWEPGRWYDVLVILDRDPASALYGTYSVWIDGTLRGQDLPLAKLCRWTPAGWVCDGDKHPEWIESIALVSGHAGVQVAYDDVRVFVPGATYWLAVAYDGVADLFADEVLNAGQANALSVKLVHALRQLDAGRPQVALRLLDAFVAQVESLVADGVLTPEQGDALIQAAERISAAIIDSLG